MLTQLQLENHWEYRKHFEMSKCISQYILICFNILSSNFPSLPTLVPLVPISPLCRSDGPHSSPIRTHGQVSCRRSWQRRCNSSLGCHISSAKKRPGRSPPQKKSYIIYIYIYILIISYLYIYIYITVWMYVYYIILNYLMLYYIMFYDMMWYYILLY